MQESVPLGAWAVLFEQQIVIHKNTHQICFYA